MLILLSSQIVHYMFVLTLMYQFLSLSLDLDELNSDLPTLLGVCVGIGVLAGLICMVLHLFSKTKYPRHRNFGDANLPPPIMYSSETGNVNFLTDPHNFVHTT